jgi:hypothetical protein
MKISPGRIRTLLTVPAEIAESIASKKWGEAMRKVFWIHSRKVALLEAERNAPGREVAYVVQAQEKFSPE